MTEMNSTIIKMINSNKSLHEICEKTNLSSKQLFYRLYLLKLKGYNFNRKYYYNGDIRYKINTDIENENKKILITDKNNNNFKAIIISDLHLVNKYERIDLLNKVYEFAIKNNYHIIINAGDVIDGLIGNVSNKKYTDIIEQIEYALKVYPYDKKIINFICFGNHDYDAFINTGVDIESVFDIRRHDLVSLGYGYGNLYVKNDLITVVHPKCVKRPDSLYDKGLIIEGHHHNVGYKENGYGRIIQVNSLSDVISKSPTGFMTINSKFNNGILDRALIESYLYINDKMIKSSEYECNLSNGKNVSYIDIENEEDFKILTKNNRLNQKEKFYLKYNK